MTEQTGAPEGAETLTEAELTEALKRRSYLPDPAEYASRIFADVAAHREPEPEPGQAWQAANGVTYLRSDIGDWVARNGVRLRHEQPRRPLRKLVPLPSHDELVAVLVESITDDVSGYEGQAQRILKLLSGGDDD